MESQYSLFIYTKNNLSPENGWDINGKYEMNQNLRKIINNIYEIIINDSIQIESLFYWPFEFDNKEAFIYHYEKYKNNLKLFYLFERNTINNEIKHMMFVLINKNDPYYPKHKINCKIQVDPLDCKCYSSNMKFFNSKYKNHLKKIKLNYDKMTEINSIMIINIKKKKYSSYSEKVQSRFFDLRKFL